MAANESEEDRLVRQQRLKAALHYAVGKTCEDVGRSNKVSFTREVIAAIAETAFQKCEAVSVDLQLFAKHAKRTTINTDDVKLISRKNEQLHSFLTEEEERLKALKVKEGADTAKGKSKKPVAKPKNQQPPVVLDDSD